MQITRTTNGPAEAKLPKDGIRAAVEFGSQLSPLEFRQQLSGWSHAGGDEWPAAGQGAPIKADPG